jgi:hypothetical protein
MSLREQTKLKYVDIKTRMRGNLRATVWKDKTHCRICTIHKHKPISVMSVDVLCNQPWYNTVTDMWGMCTNLTAWKILVPIRDGPGNGQTSYFSTL